MATAKIGFIGTHSRIAQSPAEEARARYLFLSHLRAGATRATAARRAGIHREQGQEWASSETPYGEACRDAEVDALSTYEDLVLREARNDPRLALSVLRIRHPDWQRSTVRDTLKDAEALAAALSMLSLRDVQALPPPQLGAGETVEADWSQVIYDASQIESAEITGETAYTPEMPIAPAYRGGRKQVQGQPRARRRPPKAPQDDDE